MTRRAAEARILGGVVGHATALAYVDPGNVATSITAGSTYGYLLVWVVIVSTLMAMLIQYLAAKAGIATGTSLPALCREHLPRPVTRGLWLQGEVVAIATDLAEVVGGALALEILVEIWTEDRTPPATTAATTAPTLATPVIRTPVGPLASGQRTALPRLRQQPPPLQPARPRSSARPSARSRLD